MHRPPSTAPPRRRSINTHLARSLATLLPATPPASMSAVSKEFGEYHDEEEDHDLMAPRHTSSSLQIDDDSSFRPIQTSTSTTHNKSLLYYLATIQAFLIIYRTEVTLSILLFISLSIGISDLLSHTASHSNRHVDPFAHAHISTDYTSSNIRSKYDLTLGKIDHWCLADKLHGENDNLCSCEDPLEPTSRSSSHKWFDQHKENIKSVTEVLVKTNAIYDTSYYTPGSYDDLWMERLDDDWVYGKGARFGDDDIGGGAFVNELDDLEYDYDDGFGIPVESGESGGEIGEEIGESDDGIGRGLTTATEEEYVLDVVFLGDSITEQRQGTSMGREDPNYIGIKEVFDKTFSKDKVSKERLRFLCLCLCSFLCD
jgi:hypothetical protein